jgi:hypothetical protein
MSTLFSWRRDVVLVGAGILLGGALVAFLSAKASKPFLKEAEFVLVTEQFLETTSALNAKKYEEALAHSRCALFVATARSRQRQEPLWPIWYPAVGLTTDLVVPPNNLVLSSAHARVAYILEHAKREEDAAFHYRAAATLLGKDDVEAIRAVARGSLEQR